MSERLIWAFDCDDVLVPTAQYILNAYNQAYGANVQPSAFYDNDDDWGAGSNEEAIRRVDQLMRGGLMEKAMPDQGAVWAIHQLAKLDTLHLVTGRQSYLEQTTLNMLDTYFPGCFQTVQHTNYIAPSDSKAIRRSKGEVCAELRADVLVDDHIVHGESVLAAGVKEVVVWGDYDWNRRQKLAAGMVRCANWADLLAERGRILERRK